MKIIGYLLITVGFLAGAYAGVRSVEQVEWTLFFPALAAGVAGVAVSRLASRLEKHSGQRVETDLDAVGESLRAVVRDVEDLHSSCDGIDVYELRHHVDRRFPENLENFVTARESVARRFGLQAYADLMSHFAAGERFLNRVWSCSTDGYIDEAHASLERAAVEFRQAQEQLEALGDRSGKPESH